MKLSVLCENTTVNDTDGGNDGKKDSSQEKEPTDIMGYIRYIWYKLIGVFYEKEDETELLIRVLSFGPVLKVIFPDDFVKKLCERLEKQKKLRTQT